MGADMDSEYFVSINEVAKRLNVPAHTLRYWERQFPTAIRPTTGAGGRRYYRPEMVTRLETIKSLLYDRGMTIAGVKKILHNGDLNEEVNTFKSTGAVSVMPATPKANNDIDAIGVAISYLEQAKTFLE